MSAQDEHTVKVWDKSCLVSVYQKSKSVWVAVGEYMGNRIEVRASSNNSALAHWRRAALYKGKC
jgi:hypothetical protein